jgi:predicted nucleic acid-binding Zn ribbon protein
MLPVADGTSRIATGGRWTVGGPRRACAQPGCPYVFVGSPGTRYCSAECQELERREREAERKRRRRRDAGASIRSTSGFGSLR